MHMENGEFRSLPSVIHKINVKWIIDLNIELKL